MSADRRMFFSPEAEVAYYVPPSDLPFLSLAIWSERTRQWVPMLFTANREFAAGQASRAADGGFTYWIIPLAEDDEALELAHWRAMSPPDSVAFRKMLEDAVTAPH